MTQALKKKRNTQAEEVTTVGEVKVYLIDVYKYFSHKPTGKDINTLTDLESAVMIPGL